MSNVQLFLLVGAAMASILVAAAMPSGPSMLTDRAWGDNSRSAFQQASPPDRLRR